MNPLIKILALVQRLTSSALCAAIPNSLVLLRDWGREAITERNTAADTATTIDDPLEQRYALLEQALANDPPSIRNEILEAYREVRARTAAHAEQLRIQIPLSLQ